MYKINFTETYLKLSLLKIYARLTITSNNISEAMRHSSKILLYVISNIISKVTYHLLSDFLYSRLPVKLLTACSYSCNRLADWTVSFSRSSARSTPSFDPTSRPSAATPSSASSSQTSSSCPAFTKIRFPWNFNFSSHLGSQHLKKVSFET